MSKYRNTVLYDFKSRFLFIFSSNYQHRIVLKIPFPNHIFPKISKYSTKNLHFSFIGKCDAASKQRTWFIATWWQPDDSNVRYSANICVGKNILKTSWRRFSSSSLGDVFNTSSIPLQDALQRHLQDFQQ